MTKIQNWLQNSLLFSLILLTSTRVNAQISPDDTLGAESSRLTPNVPINGASVDRVDGGALRGSNLFHSFTQFNINDGQRVYFGNPAGVQNILTRVTGGQGSNILGTLGVLGNANLLFMNPNGIVFGQNARLDINGSFVASTAKSFVFGNGLEFSATNPQAPPLLKINVPIGLQTGTNQGDIANAGKLAVDSGKNLTLFANTVTSTGSLIAPGGTVQLLGERVALLNNAQIDVSSNTGGGTVLIGGDFQGRGTIPTAKRTYIGPRVNINADALKTGNGGNVIIWADEVTGFYGNITARGGSVSGNGGLVEVSGKQNLIFRGSVNNSAINGLLGSLLLDPTNIIIANDSGDEIGDGTDTFAGNYSGITGSILSAPLSQINDTVPTTIYESELEGLSGNTNIILQATNDITVNPLSDRTLNLASGSGQITFTADADRDGIGNFQMDTADTIKTNGRDISISGASLTLGNIDTSFVKLGDIIAVDVYPGGDIPVSETEGTAIFGFTVSESQPIADLDVQFSASHSWDSDLAVYLTSPSGIRLELFNRIGGDGDNFQDTLLDDSAATSINNGSPPFQGRFKPTGDGGLASFNGENPTGIWQLEVTDNYLEADSGVLYKAGETAPWGIADGTKLIFRPITGDNGSITLNATKGNINVGNINAGSLTGQRGEVHLTATENIKLNGSLAAVNNIKILADADVNGIGNFLMNTTDTIKTNGRNAEITGVNLTVGNIDTSDEQGGGNITLTATGGDISTQNLNSSSSSDSGYGNPGAGGAITLYTTQGNISTQNLDSSSSSDSGYGNPGAGGAITLYTTQGNISTQNLDSSSFAFMGGDSGGAIALSTTGGDISTGNLDSGGSYGGAIALSTTGGDISTGNLSSWSHSYGGAIALSTTGGDIFTGDLRSSSSYGNGADITLKTTQSNISTKDIDSSSLNGNGADITLKTTQGNISTENLVAYGQSGGAISLETTQGDISTKDIFSFSYSNRRDADAGSGGAISLSTTQGDISTKDISSFSYSEQINAGNGGEITLTASGGEIRGIRNKDSQEIPVFSSFSVSETGNSQNGGNVTLAAKNQITDLEILTLSSDSKSGDVQIKGFGDLSLTNTDIITSKQLIIKLAFPQREITLVVGGVGQSGNVTFTSTGNLTFNNSRVESNTIGSDPAGNVTITSLGTVTFNNVSQITSNTSSQGKAGNIQINANNLVLKDDSEISASTIADGKAGDIILNTPTLTLANGGKIFATTTDNGDGGTITINAANQVNLGIGVQDFAPILSVETTGAGKAGDIIVNTPSLRVSDTARITATATATATNKDGGGSITLNASKMDLAGIVGVFAETQGQAPAGTLKLNPYQNQPNLDITLFPNSTISASTSASGKGGDLILAAPENINIAGQGKLAVESTGSGDAGNISITTQNLNIDDGVKISAATNNLGKGGNIQINANNLVLKDDSEISASTTADGKAGDIILNTPTLTLANGGKIFATTTDNGDGGTITINAANQVNLGIGVQDFAPILSVETTGAGKAGDIIVNTPSLTVSDTARITATATQTATNTQGGGSITLNASVLDLAGIVGIFAETQGQAPAGTLQLNPYQNQPNLDIALFPNSTISASTSASGKGGDLILTAPENINIAGQGKLAVESTGIGDAGNISITTQNLNIDDGVKISAATNNLGKGGNIQINANNLVLKDASEISASTIADGKAGDIILNTPTLTLANGGKIFATTTDNGDGGTITINAANQVNLGIGVQDFAPILSVETTGAGKAGDIIVNTPSLRVSDTARITATATATATNKDGGGSITLNASVLDLAGIVGVFAETQGQAPAGTLQLNPYQNQPNLDIALFPNSTISASTSASGKGGDLILTAPENINIAGQGKLAVESTGSGDAGNISITTQNLNIDDGVKISAATNNLGKGGNIQINANNLVLKDDSEISASTTADGKAGDIILNTPTLTLANGGKIFATTTDNGDGGTITINAANQVNLGIGVQDFAPILSVETTGAGKAGDIIVNTPSLTVSDTARITATATATATNTEGGGSITLNASKLDLAGIVGVFAETQGQAPAGTLQLNPYQNQPNLDIALFPNSTISASTSASGKGGDLILTATENINITGKGKLAVESTGIGDAGNIQITTQNLNINDGVKISASTINSGKGGNININANTLTANNDAQFLTTTSGTAVAGNINVKIRDNITLDGTNTGLFANTEKGSTGDSGNITIDAGNFSLRDGAYLQASTSGQGNAGNVTVAAKNAVSLVDGRIFSTVEAGGVGNGGNIDINAATLSLFNGAQLLTFTRGASGNQQAGRGDAGNVNVKVTGAVEIAGAKNGVASGIRSEVETGTVGNGGNITIDAGDFSLREGAVLQASTSGQGNAGNVTVAAKDAVSLVDGRIFSTVEAGGVGQGGTIDINAATLSLFDGAQLLTITSGASGNQQAGRGDAGNVDVKVTGAVDIAGAKNGVASGIRSEVEIGTVGNGGNITIDASDFSLREGAVLQASTSGQGNAGNVTVAAKDAVSLVDGRIFSTVEAGGVGQGGTIDINAATLSLFDGAQLLTITSGASEYQQAGRGDAGNVDVKVTGAVNIAGVKNGVASGIRSEVEIGTVGNGGNITIDASDFSLREGAVLQASTSGQGNAGNVTVAAKDAVSLVDGRIFSTVEAGGVGNGGNIDINAGNFSLGDGAQLTASTNGQGNAGYITIDARDTVNFDNGFAFSSVERTGIGNGGNLKVTTGSLYLTNGGRLIATTLGQGNAGDITINARDTVKFDGSNQDRLPSGAFSNVALTGIGNGGNIFLQSDTLTLNNGALIDAQTTNGQGGNIDLQLANFLWLRRGSQISTTAGLAQAGGNGGNITINSPFIVALPYENSDITANAFSGQGGNVDITAQTIFGIQVRPQLTSQSDITASSELGIQGEITITQPQVQPPQRLLELPTGLVDASTQIAQTCPRGPNAKPLGKFVVTGRGSLPPTSLEPLTGATSLSPLAGLDGENAHIASDAGTQGHKHVGSSSQIVEAQGLVKTADGNIMLVAQAPNATPAATSSSGICPSL